MMRTLFLILAVLVPLSARADGDAQRGADLVEQGMTLLMQSLMDQMKPTLEEIAPKLQELAPQLEVLRDKIIDFSAYELPEVLPNGDILIRKKQPVPDDGEVDL